MKLQNLKGYKLLQAGSIALAQIELNGIRVDIPKAKTLLAEVEKDIAAELESIGEIDDVKEWEKETGKKFDVNSNPVLRSFFFDYLGLESIKKTKGGNDSVDVEVIEELEHPVADKLRVIRKLEKKKSYIAGILKHTSKDGFLHSFFHLNSTITYRSSSSNINFQNIPRRDESMNVVRQLFIPRPGHQWLEADYSSIEVKTAACYTNDQNLIRYVSDKSTDMHRDVAAEIFKVPVDKVPKDLRGMVKGGFVFAQFYGSYWKQCAARMWKDIRRNSYEIDGVPLLKHMRKHGIGDYHSFEAHVREIENNFWNHRFRGYAKWKENIWNEYLKNGYIESYTGFRYKGYMKRNAVTNYPIQGSAFHILLWSLIHLQKFFVEKKLKSKILGQIHDSILVDVYPPEMELVIKAIKKIGEYGVTKVWNWIIVPLEIEVEVAGVNEAWSEKKAI